MTYQELEDVVVQGLRQEIADDSLSEPLSFAVANACQDIYNHDHGALLSSMATKLGAMTAEQRTRVLGLGSATPDMCVKDVLQTNLYMFLVDQVTERLTRTRG